MEESEPKHYLYRGIVFVMLFVTWFILSGFNDGFHLTLGIISCGLVTWMSSDLLFEHRDASVFARLRQMGRLLAYVGWLVWQIFLANLHLLKLSFSPRSALQPHILRYESNLETDFERFLLANSITLTPGTVTIKIIGNIYYIHAISDIAAQGLDGEMERRIRHIFETSPSRKTSEA